MSDMLCNKYESSFQSPVTEFLRSESTLVSFSQCNAKNKNRLAKKRTKSYKNIPSHMKRLIEPYSKSGFYFLKGNIICAFCGLSLSFGKYPIMKTHKKNLPMCPFLLNLDVGNIPATRKTSKRTKILQEDKDAWKDDWANISPNILTSRDLFLSDDELNEMDVDWREATFINDENIKHLALTGNYFRKKGDTKLLCCYKCNLETIYSESMAKESPNTFHDPQCNFVTEITGKKNSMQYHVDQETVIEVLLAKKLPLSPDYVTVLHNKFQEDGTFYDCKFELYLDLIKSRKEGHVSTPPVAKETHLQSGSSAKFCDYLCAKCHRQSVEVVFTPCHHLSCCGGCARDIDKCVTCDATINRKIFLDF